MSRYESHLHHRCRRSKLFSFQWSLWVLVVQKREKRTCFVWIILPPSFGDVWLSDNYCSRLQQWLLAAVTTLSTNQIKVSGLIIQTEAALILRERRRNPPLDFGATNHGPVGTAGALFVWAVLPSQVAPPRPLKHTHLPSQPPRKVTGAGCPLEMIEKSSLSPAAAVHPFHQRRPPHYINCRSSFHPIEFSPPTPPPTPPYFWLLTSWMSPPLLLSRLTWHAQETCCVLAAAERRWWASPRAGSE